MTSSEKFCLKWNEFEANIGVAFRELREDNDFFDVTLACDDEQVQAHKVIISACSPFFRKVLKRNLHEHPLLYLKGVRYKDIYSILNFMYHGQVNVAQEDLDSFLTLAEDLQIKGLTQSTKVVENTTEIKEERVAIKARNATKEPIPAPPPVKPKGPRPAPANWARPESSKKPHYEDDDIQEIIPVNVKVEQLATVNPVKVFPAIVTENVSIVQTFDIDQELVENIDSNDVSVDYEEYNIDQDEPGDGSTFDASLLTNSFAEGEFDLHLKTVLEKFTKKIVNRDGNYLWQCKSCQKIYKRKSHLVEHVESCHVTGLQFKCPYCSVYYKTRSSVRHHVNDKHKDDHSQYKMDMVNLEWAIVQ